ncbi:hypothetical protein AB0K08_06030 [Citricoccus sp. NPDC055426]|uniref:hypothetical protein n=1 Tax=Citricoccus sp. NPDC055426 TaxID=3155536 RepID=UPI003416C602
MSDWRFEFTDDPAVERDDPAMDELERRLDTSADRVGRAQSELQRAVRELIPVVQEASVAGMPVGRIASFARISSDDAQRIVDTGRLY